MLKQQNNLIQRVKLEKKLKKDRDAKIKD